MKSRILTSDQLAQLPAHVRESLIDYFGTSMTVDQRWAEEAGNRFSSWVCSYMVDQLLPPGWDEIYVEVRMTYYLNNDRWDTISFAVFAALYVEAGKP